MSAAGKRAGIKDGTRSGLWAVFADAIDALRPQYVIIENVRGLLSATAHRAVESDDAVVGDRSDRPVLRALGAVLGDLSDLGYDATWATVAAASVGAPHRRERVFILAEVADAEGTRRSVRDTAHVGQAHREVNAFADDCGIALNSSRYGWDEGRPESAGLVGGFDAAVSGDEPGVALLPTPRATDPAGAHSRSSEGFRPQLGEVVRTLGVERGPEPVDVSVGEDDSAVPVLPGDRGGEDALVGAADGDGVAVDVCGAENSHSSGVPAELAGTKHLLPTPNASDGSGGGQHPDKREGHSRQLIDTVLALPTPLLQTPQARDGKGLPGQGFNKGNFLSQIIELAEECRHPADARLISDSAIGCGVCSCRLSVEDAAQSYRQQWGKYAPAIARWEQIVGPAPAPTEPNKNGNPRLSAAFSEWLMGWPAGWVTDPAIGISRNDQLRIVGNGVVTAQAEATLRYLLSVTHD